MSFENATFRLLWPDGSMVGMGFLLTPTLGVTCAHLVKGQTGSLQLKFNGLDALFQATVEEIRDQRSLFWGSDAVLLRLSTAPEGISPLALDGERGSLDGSVFRMFGYAAQGSAQEIHTDGRFIDMYKMRNGQEWLRLESNLPMPEPDMIGTPVWDETHGVVTGMVINTSPSRIMALPAEAIWQLFPLEAAAPSDDSTSAIPPVIIEDGMRGLPDDYETKGVDSPTIGADDVPMDFDDAAGDEPEVAPPPPAPAAKRLLNANFATVNNDHVLSLDEPLHAQQPYHLLVDVGLPWDKIPSLLGENAAFPEDSQVAYLRAEDRQKGWFDVEVVFVSQEFEPNLVSGHIRVPVGTLERSTAYVNGSINEAPGPLQLRVSPKNTGLQRAHGRLCLYYGAQILQSAVLDVSLGAPGPNSAIVDYVLTPGFANIGSNIAERQRTDKDGNITSKPVKVGLMLNDDLSGTHRILLKVANETDETASLPPAWKAYDAGNIRQKLEEARRILTGGTPNYESDTFAFDKFKADLLALATLGAELYAMLLQGLTPGNGISPGAWRQKFRKALQPGEVIQLARAASVPATHIIPWALTYDYPLELDRSDKPLVLCRVVDEQWSSSDAKRKAPFNAQENIVCPYEHEHAENTVCPFGFWGYKYTLEQPISARTSTDWDVEPARRIRVETPVKMAVASTEDVSHQERRLQHFQRIHDSVNAKYIPGDAPATERDQVRDSLNAPQLVYILCHGGKDGELTYLSIGPRGSDARYTITPEMPGAWVDRGSIDMDKWEETRPLVFINGCYTTDLLPDLTLNFVSAFRDLAAGGVIGTEIPVTVEHGYMAAEKFFERLGRHQDIGQAILGMRWDLLNQGSLLGLAYTPYAMSDLHLEH